MAKKQGRKSTQDYYKTKKPDNVELVDTIIFLPISPSDLTYDPNLDMQIKIISDCQEVKHYSPETLEYSNIGSSSSKLQYDDFNELEPIVVNTTTEIYNISLNDKKNLLVCWHCCHTFDNQPIHSPTELKNKVYKTKGYFCSFNCCYTYTKDSQKKYLVNYMFKDMTNKPGVITEHVKPAPPRETLKIFGGFLTIEEFRNGNETYVIKPCVFDYQPMQIEKIKPDMTIKKHFKVLQPSKEKQKSILPPNSLGKILGIKQLE